MSEPGYIWDRPPVTDDAFDLLQRASAKTAKSESRLLLVFDQFEELFILKDTDAQFKFACLLKKIAESDLKNVLMLVVMRQEYESLVVDLDLPRLKQAENWFVVGAFTHRAAYQFVQNSGLRLDAEQVERMLAGAARIDDTGGLFRPITLNMLGLVFSQFGNQLPPGFDADRVIQNYLRVCITEPLIRNDAPLILKEMITDAGTKRPCTEVELSNSSSRPLANVRHCLLVLGKSGLVRPLGQEQAVWEISHDFIARVLGQMLGRMRPSKRDGVLIYGGPAFAALWALTIIFGIAFLPAWRYHKAIQELNDVGFRLERVPDDGSRLFSENLSRGGLKAGAYEVLLSKILLFNDITFLEVVEDDELKNLSIAPEMRNLRHFVISDNPKLEQITGLSFLGQLRNFMVGDNVKLKLVDLNGLESLEHFELSDNLELETVASLAAPKNLRSVEIIGNSSLKYIFLNVLEESVVLREEVYRRSLPPLVWGSPREQEFTENYERLYQQLAEMEQKGTRSEGMVVVDKLEALRIVDNKVLKFLDLRKLVALRELVIFPAFPPGVLSSIGMLPNLERLAIGDRISASECIEKLAGAPKLKRLIVVRNPEFADPRLEKAINEFHKYRQENKLQRVRIEFLGEDSDRWRGKSIFNRGDVKGDEAET